MIKITWRAVEIDVDSTLDAHNFIDEINRIESAPTALERQRMLASSHLLFPYRRRIYPDVEIPDEIVAKIKRDALRGVTGAELARKYNKHPSWVYLVLRGKIRKGVSPAK